MVLVLHLGRPSWLDSPQVHLICFFSQVAEIFLVSSKLHKIFESAKNLYQEDASSL